MEEATNAGVVFIHKFRLNSRDAKLSLDAYYTTFQNQIVADWETLGKISFYALQGRSYSTNLQAEIEWSPIRRLDWRIAYRYLDAKTTYASGLLDRPLYARHRFFTNLGYSTKEKDNGSKWTFDATARWLGTQRIPLSEAHLEHLEMSSKAPAYWIFNAQVAYFFSTKFEVYAGGENLGNFMQHHPIISAENPQSAIFDASLIYAPIFGRMGYVGLRWRIGGEKSKD
jgi:outer membrane receptor protein involved in Fe transport